MTKTMKYELTYLSGCGNFNEMQNTMWSVSKDVRSIMNKTTQLCFDWDMKNTNHFETFGEYLSTYDETGYKQYRSYIYNSLKSDYSLPSSKVLLASINYANNKYKTCKRYILSGEQSVPSYKKDQPIIIPSESIKPYFDGEKARLDVSILSKKYKSEKRFDKFISFSIKIKDNSQRTIFNKIIECEYKIGACKIKYDKPKWFLMLTYSFEPEKKELNPDKVLGVDVGQAYAIYASSFGNRGVFKIEGGEVEEYAKRCEAKIRSMQNQATVCGNGRVGHGTKTRVAPIYKSKNKVENYRKTINDTYSRKLVDWAVNNQYGVLQMEDLSGIKEDTGFPKRLRHWTYYDLQSKVEQKCSEAGIVFRKIPAQYTSQRCSRCGCIDRNNRKTQAEFHCVSCGFESNADYNASQNISIPYIGEIIEETIGANQKQA